MLDGKKTGYKKILKEKEFMKTVIASIINRVGDSIDSIAFVWLVYQVTQSAAWSAIIFGVNQLPTIFLQPFAGAFVERRNKKNIMVITDLIRGICVGVVATAFIMGFLNQWILLLMTIIISSAEAYRKPASTAFIPRLLDRGDYEFGLSLNSSVSSIAELIGLGVAGIIIGTFSISVAIYIDMATFFISAFLIFMVKMKDEREEEVSDVVGEQKNSVKEGLFYIKKRPVLMYYAIVGVFLNGILVPYNSLQAPIISEVLHASEILLSIHGIALSVGMIVGSSIYPYIGAKFKNKFYICVGGYGIGLFYISFILIGKWITAELPLYIAISFVSFLVGIIIALANSVFNVQFIKAVDESYLARVSALLGATCMAAIPIVSFLVSIAVKVVPTSTILLIAGALSITFSLFLGYKKLDDDKYHAMEESIDDTVANTIAVTMDNNME